MEDTQTDCQKVLAELEAYLDREVAGALCADIQAHLERCAPCLKRADFERHLKEIVASRCREGKAPDQVLQRIRAAIERT